MIKPEITISMTSTSINIILDSKLQAKLPDQSSLENKPNQALNLSTPDQYYLETELTQGLLPNPRTKHGLVNGFLFAYNNHLPLKLRPDDLQLIIQLVLSTCVNRNPESLRYLFVNHEGQMNLSYEDTEFNLDEITAQFKKLMKAHLKDPQFAEKFTQTYSTTTPVAGLVSNTLLMNTLKEYFSYEFILGCGIPNVVLEGTLADWERLESNYQYFKEIFKVTELVNWFRHFDVVMGMFMKMRRLQQTGQHDVEATDDLKEFWARVISYVPQGSGGDTILGGWIRLLIPYAGENELVGGLDANLIPCLDLNQVDPNKGQTRGGYDMQDKLKDFYFAHGWSSVPDSIVATPMKFTIPGQGSLNMELHSGFFASVFKDGSVQMNIGVKITENLTLKAEAEKQSYLERGVQKTQYSIQIPRTLRKEASQICALFQECGYNFYGTDPLEEIEKQAFRDLGVDDSGYYLKVPQVLMDRKSEIMEVFGKSDYELRCV
jgi:hypothetical protein